jgi:hypothetical protein
MEDLPKLEQPQVEQSILKSDLNVSLHYPFTKNTDKIVGNVETALARIRLVRSGKPHVTGTIPPKLDVKPEGLDETPAEVPPVVQEVVAAPVMTAATEGDPEMDKEEYKKMRKKERRLARKAKKAGEVEEEKPTTPPGGFKHDWHKKNLVTNKDMTDSYECTKCGQKYKRHGFTRSAPEFGCTKE